MSGEPGRGVKSSFAGNWGSVPVAGNPPAAVFTATGKSLLTCGKGGDPDEVASPPLRLLRVPGQREGSHAEHGEANITRPT